MPQFAFVKLSACNVQGKSGLHCLDMQEKGSYRLSRSQKPGERSLSSPGLSSSQVIESPTSHTEQCNEQLSSSASCIVMQSNSMIDLSSLASLPFSRTYSHHQEDILGCHASFLLLRCVTQSCNDMPSLSRRHQTPCQSKMQGRLSIGRSTGGTQIEGLQPAWQRLPLGPSAKEEQGHAPPSSSYKQALPVHQSMQDAAPIAKGPTPDRGTQQQQRLQGDGDQHGPFQRQGHGTGQRDCSDSIEQGSIFKVQKAKEEASPVVLLIKQLVLNRCACQRFAVGSKDVNIQVACQIKVKNGGKLPFKWPQNAEVTLQNAS